ncbi:MAG: LysE family transporter [Thermoplasmata archaeon]|nr:MAG: LysE family transporter [Thermoplasmata archaeon]
MSESLALLGSLILITLIVSLSGVLMPGPVLAATVAKGYKDKHAGLGIGIGHGIIEVPLIAVIGLGLGVFFKNLTLQLIIGLAGGAMLAFLGINMIRMRKDTTQTEKYLPYHSLVVGMLMTVANPYWFLWWATIGASLILFSLQLGLLGLVIFTIVHVSCDVVWDYFVSYSVNKSKKFWRTRTHEFVFILCGIIMIVFGIYFIIWPFLDFYNII